MKEVIKKILREDLVQRPMLLKESCNISESLKHHIDNRLTLSENVFRPYSDNYFHLINEVRELYSMDMIELNKEDEWLVNTDIGKTAYYNGDEVWLDIPFRDGNFLSEAEYRGRKVNLNSPFRTPGGPKKFSVYVKNKTGNVIKVSFGDPNLRVRSNNPKAAKSFRARHKCHTKKDKTTAGYWSCNISRYRKKLGIKSSSPW
jgi:hypothetical protein